MEETASDVYQADRATRPGGETYLQEVTGGDEERRVLLLALCTLLSQRRQSLQTQLIDLRTHPEHTH